MHAPTLKTSEPSRYASVTCSFMGFALNSLLREPRFFLFGKPLDKENSGAESVCNKLYSSRVPLNLFVRKLSMWSSLTGIRLECSHIAGEKNDDADALSRWDGIEEPLPTRFHPSDRFEVSLQEFWDIQFQVQLLPSDQHLLWPLPASHMLGPSMKQPRKRK